MFGFAHLHRCGGLRFERLAALRVLQGFQLQEHAAQVGFDDLFRQLQFDRCLRAVTRTRTGGVEVERVHVKRIAVRDQQVYFEGVGGEVLGETAHAVAARAETHHHFAFLHLGHRLRRCRWR